MLRQINLYERMYGTQYTVYNILYAKFYAFKSHMQYLFFSSMEFTLHIIKSNVNPVFRYSPVAHVGLNSVHGMDIALQIN